MSEILVNKLTGTSTAGSILVTGEGNSTTTNLQQGLCKVWASISGGGTPAIEDSLNVSGITDVSTGRRKPAYTNNMGNATYLVIAGVMADGNTNGARGASGSQIADRNAAYIDYTIYYGSSSGSDGSASDGATIDGIGIAGDLA
jgi:hypothetical protein